MKEKYKTYEEWEEENQDKVLQNKKGRRFKTTYQKCPVCNGRGFVACGFYDVGGFNISLSMTSEKCRSCQGTGYIAEPKHEINDLGYFIK